MKILNLTPHVISLKCDGCVRIIEPDGPPVRIKTRMGPAVTSEDGVTIHAPSRTIGIQNLPDSRPKTYLIVSQIAALAAAKLCPDRTDIVYPATSPYQGAERDENGILAVSRLIRAS